MSFDQETEALVRTFRKDRVAFRKIGVPREQLIRVAAWLVATYGDIVVSPADFSTEKDRLEIARRCGARDVAIAIAKACSAELPPFDVP
jgi:hypothetical protein